MKINKMLKDMNSIWREEQKPSQTKNTAKKKKKKKKTKKRREYQVLQEQKDPSVEFLRNAQGIVPSLDSRS